MLNLSSSDDIRGILFDYGGTLDTAGQHWGQVLWHACQREGLPVTEKLFREAYVYGERYLGNNPIIKPCDTFRRTLSVKLRLELEFLCAHGWDADEGEFARRHDSLLAKVYAHVRQVTAHSASVLAKLHETYPMVLVSNFYGNIRTVLREFALDGFFEDVVESAEVGIRKPDPRIWTIGVERLGMEPREVVVVGDSFYKDVEPALKAGCHAVWFKGEGWTRKTYDETVPDRVITDIAQLLAVPTPRAASPRCPTASSPT